MMDEGREIKAEFTTPMDMTEAGRLLMAGMINPENVRTFRLPDGSYETLIEAYDPDAEFPAEI